MHLTRLKGVRFPKHSILNEIKSPSEKSLLTWNMFTWEEPAVCWKILYLVHINDEEVRTEEPYFQNLLCVKSPVLTYGAKLHDQIWICYWKLCYTRLIEKEASVPSWALELLYASGCSWAVRYTGRRNADLFSVVIVRLLFLFLVYLSVCFSYSVN